MTSKNGKVLLIVGGIANFTDVSKTFDGIIDALNEKAEHLRKKGVKVFVRRGGPNYKEGLTKISKACNKIGLQHRIYTIEEPMTKIISDVVEEI